MVAVPSKGRADLQAPAREADATRALYEQYGRQVYAYCFSRLRSREEAEDAVQSTFLNAFRALQRDVAPVHESAWLYKIAENVCLTRARSSVRRRRVETPGDLEAIGEIVPAHAPETDELANLPQALESMPELQRRALLLREWQGLSYREIADELELTQSAVETLLFRARRTLAAGLVTEEPKRRGKLARLRAGGDAGAVAALLKTLLFSGGAKVVIAGAVAATGVVGIAPTAQNRIDELFLPKAKTSAPVHHVVAAKPKTVLPVVVAPVHHVVAPAKKKQHRAVLAHPVKLRHLGRFGRIDQSLRPPAAPVDPPAATATPVAPIEATPPAQGKAKGKSDSSPQPTPPAPVVPAPAMPLPSPAPDGHQSHGHDSHGHGKP